MGQTGCRIHARQWALPLLLLLFILVVATPSSQAQGKLYVLIVDELTWDQLTDQRYPTLAALAKRSYVASMVTRTAGATTTLNSVATIGASGRSFGTGSIQLAFNKDTPLQTQAASATGTELVTSATDSPNREQQPALTAAQIYERRTGRWPQGEIVNLGIEDLQRRNQGTEFGATPAALGTVLRDNDVVVAYLGNGDTHHPNRARSALFMDEDGQIPLGNVEVPPAQDPVFPFSLRTDFLALREEIEEVKGQADLIAIEITDLARINGTASQYSAAQIELLRHLALTHLDYFVNEITAQLEGKDQLLVLVPTPPAYRLNVGDTLVPFLIHRPNGTAGLVVSPSTRRSGVITNLDVGPTILAWFDIPAPERMYGRRVNFVDHPRALEQTIEMRDRIVAVAAQRNHFLRELVYINIGLYIAATLFILLPEMPPWFGYLLRLTLPIAMSTPLALLLLPLVQPATPTLALVWALGIAAALALLIRLLTRRTIGGITLLAALTCAVILLDTVTGARLMQNSVLGYDPMGGARFYGIGNEYMGVLVGMAIIAIAPSGTGCPACSAEYHCWQRCGSP